MKSSRFLLRVAASVMILMWAQTALADHARWRGQDGYFQSSEWSGSENFVSWTWASSSSSLKVWRVDELAQATADAISWLQELPGGVWQEGGWEQVGAKDNPGF